MKYPTIMRERKVAVLQRLVLQNFAEDRYCLRFESVRTLVNSV